MDYCARQKFGRTSLNMFFVRQFPAPTPADLAVGPPSLAGLSWIEWLSIRVLELVYCSYEMDPLAADLDIESRPFRWERNRRLELMAEVNAGVAHLYGVSLAELQYILDTFPIARRDEESRYGEYRTRRLILECFDRLSDALRSDRPYLTMLVPEPGKGPRHPKDMRG